MRELTLNEQKAATGGAAWGVVGAIFTVGAALAGLAGALQMAGAS